MTNRAVDDPDNVPSDVRVLVMLHWAGWSIGDVAAEGEDGRPVWIVFGSNSENLIWAKDAAKVEAWGRAVASARSLGMLGKPTNDHLQGNP